MFNYAIDDGGQRCVVFNKAPARRIPNTPEGAAREPATRRTELPRANQPGRDERPGHVAQHGQDPKKHGQRLVVPPVVARLDQPRYDRSSVRTEAPEHKQIHEDAPLV